jgi:ADP-ribose pyrophosphatase YjhB (NUDIX family)
MKSDKTFYRSLPAKRMGAGCLFFNADGQVMLVKPTYKPTWEIPGGVVEKDESPKQCCQREVSEELGLNQRIGRLLVVDYNDKVDDKTESLMFIFYGGTLTPSQIESIQIDRDELSEFCFFDAEFLPVDMSVKLRNRVLKAWEQIEKGNGIYLENQEQK